MTDNNVRRNKAFDEWKDWVRHCRWMVPMLGAVVTNQSRHVALLWLRCNPESTAVNDNSPLNPLPPLSTDKQQTK